VITITILKVLFAYIIVAVGLEQIGYTSKMEINEFNNYSISPLEFHIECIVKVVCEN